MGRLWTKSANPKRLQVERGDRLCPIQHSPSKWQNATRQIHQTRIRRRPADLQHDQQDPHQYVESFQATPFPSASLLCTYTSSQLEILEDDHDLHPEVDSAIFHLFDKGAMVEVECYRVNKKKLKHEYEELRQIQHDIWKWELTLGGCARRMAGAQIYQRIELVNCSKLQVLIDEYKARHRRRQT